jgi:2-succinyl-5-enolpyruvyl-6-hydroxy-3-cyclohexene-1-carboxylate synthase
MDNLEIWTSCENCVFEEEENCKIGKLELLEKNGAELENKNGHTLIKGRLCNFKRNKSWWINHENNYEEQLKKEVIIKYGAIVNSTNVSSLIGAVDFLLQQSIQPQSLYIIYNNENFEKQSQNIQSVLDKTKKKWNLKRPLNKSTNEYEYINEYLNTGTIKESFILYITDSNLPEINLISKLNKAINEDLKQIMIYSDINYIFIPTVLAKTFGLDGAAQAIHEAGHGDKITRI